MINGDEHSSPRLPELAEVPGLAPSPGVGPAAEPLATEPASTPSLRPITADSDSSGFAVEDPPLTESASGSRAELPPLGDALGVRGQADDSGTVVPVIDVLLGKTFGGYELVEKVGQGGMGTVYKGRQVSLDRVVAVKILNRALYDNDEFIKRFKREAQSIAKISHPNIVAVYDFGQSDDGLWYMVCEFIEGSSLSKLIHDKLVLPPDELVPLMTQMLAGLAHVGATGIVHRDIKPDNVLITKEGIAKIADFGLAKDVSGNKDHTDLTAAGLAMGTPAYMSPEQCMGRRLDGRSDVYALGVTAYFALTGEKPFVGKSSFEVMTKQREHQPPPPDKLNPRVPKELSALVMRMLAKEPSDRDDADTCRMRWVELGQKMDAGRKPGVLQRSGEFEYPGAKTAARGPVQNGGGQSAGEGLVAPVADLLPPLTSLAPPPLSSMPPLAPPPLSTSNVDHRGDTDRARSGRRVGTESHDAPHTRPHSDRVTDRDVRSGTEKRLRVETAATCGRCGHLNRAALSQCTRCGAPLSAALSPADQASEAQRLHAQGQYRDAAALYARLADQEDDKRARSVWRSKEQDVRRLDHEQQVREAQSQAAAQVAKGEITAAIGTLTAAISAVSAPTAGSTTNVGPEGALLRDLEALRGRVRGRRVRRVMIAALIVVVLLALAALHLSGVIAASTSAATSNAAAAGAPP